MLEDFKHSLAGFWKSQTEDLLHKQLSISKAVLQERSGTLNQFLAGGSGVRIDEAAMEVTIPYPIYIRFLDMRRASIKTETVDKTVIRNHRKVVKKLARGKKKTNYAPIYNKYVYGYLKSATYRRLKSAIPSFMIRTLMPRMKI